MVRGVSGVSGDQRGTDVCGGPHSKNKEKKGEVVSSTQGSQLVPLASTNRARHSLTSAFE